LGVGGPVGFIEGDFDGKGVDGLAEGTFDGMTLGNPDGAELGAAVGSRGITFTMLTQENSEGLMPKAKLSATHCDCDPEPINSVSMTEMMRLIKLVIFTSPLR
jgi:hypothetical protein